jgi:hypothetical protein
MATVKVGDWIITGIKGEQYPCDAEVFEATYVPATEPTGDVAGLLDWLHNYAYVDHFYGRLTKGQEVVTELRTAVTAPQTSKAEAWVLVGELMQNQGNGQSDIVTVDSLCVHCNANTELLNEDEPDEHTLCTNPTCPAVRARKLLEERT